MSWLNPGWKKIIKRIVLSLVLVLFLFVGVVLVLVNFREEWILQKVITYINSRQSGKIVVGKMELALFSHFPNAAIEIRGLKYYGSSADVSPIIQARDVYIALDIRKLLQDSELEILGAGVDSAAVNLEKDKYGRWNFQSRDSVKTGGEDGKELSIDLHEVSLKRVYLRIKSDSISVPTEVEIIAMETSLVNSLDSLACFAETEFELRSFYVKNTHIRDVGPISTELDLGINKVDRRLTIRTGKIEFGEFNLDVQGTYQHDSKRTLDITLDGSSSKFVILRTLLKEEIIRLNPDVLKSGDIVLKGKVSGSLDEGTPDVDMDFQARNISLKLPEDLGEFRNFGFEAAFHSGDPDDFSGAILEIRNLNGKVPGGSVAGSLRVKDFTNPYIQYHLDGSANLKGYDRVFNLGSLKNFRGVFSLSSNFEGYLVKQKDKPQLESGKAEVNLLNVGFDMPAINRKVSGLFGKISLSKQELDVTDLHFKYDSADITLNGTLTFPLHLLFRRDTFLTASLLVQTRNLSTNHFVFDSVGTAQVKDRVESLDIDLTLATTVKNFWRGGFPDCRFSINNLSARLAGFPDIGGIIAHGQYTKDAQGPHLVLDDFEARLSQGEVAVKGMLDILPKRRLKLNSQVRLKQFPWEYVQQLIDALNDDDPGTTKGREKFTMINTDLDLSADFISYPFSINHLQLKDSRVEIDFIKKGKVLADPVNLAADNFLLKRNSSGNVAGLQSLHAVLDAGLLQLPGIGQTNLHLETDAIQNKEDAGVYLKLHPFQVMFPNGMMGINGDVNLPAKDSIVLALKAGLTQVTFNQLQTMLGLFQTNPSTLNTRLEFIGADLDFSTTLLLSPFSIDDLAFAQSQAEVRLADKFGLNAGSFSGHLTKIQFRGDSGRLSSINGQLNFQELDLPSIGMTQLELSTVEKSGTIDMQFKANALGGMHSGRLVVSGNPVTYRLKASLNGVSTKMMSQQVRKNNSGIMEGPLNIVMDVAAVEPNLVHTLSGHLTLSSDSLLLLGVNLDALLKDYKKSQNFNFTDLGAFMIAGPAGPVVTKGNDFARLLNVKLKPEDKTHLTRLYANWKMEQGTVSAEDVAFATEVNRVAFLGRVDFERDTIPGFKVVVLDKKGCSVIDQVLYGKTSSIQRSKPNVVGTLLGSVTNAVNVVNPVDCKPVYTGMVKHPDGK